MWSCVSLLALLIPAASAAKHAVLAGVADYDAYDSDWQDLASERDLGLMRGLLDTLGFARVEVLSDEEATHDGVLGALDAMAVRAEPGDHVVFHWSGHGFRLPDDGHDEPDGWDEALVTWGARRDGGGTFLRDDELGERLDHLRSTVGATGSVTVVLDSCYAGGALRGGLTPMRGYGPAREEAGSGHDEWLTPGEAPLVVLTAAAADLGSREVIVDGVRYGPLTHALVGALRARAPEASWARVFGDVRARMAREAPLGHQPSPRLIGSEARVPFDDAIAPQAATIPVLGAEDAGRSIVLGHGHLHGLGTGTELVLEGPEGTTLGRGRLTEVATTRSRMLLEAPLTSRDIRDPRLARARVVKAAGAAPIRVRVDLTGADAAAWRRVLEERPDLQPVDEHEEVAVVREAAGITLRTPGGAALRSPASTADLVGLAVGRRLRGLQLHDPDYEVALEVQTRRSQPPGAPGHELTLTIGEPVELVVHNRAQRRAWITILNIDDAGVAEVVKAWDEPTQPGRSLSVTPGWGDTRPSRNQLLVVATADRVDWDAVLATGPVRGQERIPEEGWATPVFYEAIAEPATPPP